MTSARRIGAPDAKNRAVLLDAAEQLLLEEGYAAVTTRRLAARAGVNKALVYYYFGTMDDLFIALFRRIAEGSLQRQSEILASEQPLWELWNAGQDQFDTRLLMEFNALANHRPAVRSEIAAYSRKFRRLQIDAIARVLDEHGVDPAEWPPAAVILMLTGVARFLLIEESFGIDVGHRDTKRVIERYLTALEGRRPRPSKGRRRA
jgi:AcrR family transcriptional regulator